jgi:Uma2 family endonuclease
MFELKEKYSNKDYEQLPEGAPYQLINGELVISPVPIIIHQRLSYRIYRLLDSFVLSHNSGEVFYAPVDVYFSDEHIVQPDIIFIANENADKITREKVTGAPDLIVEVLSLTNAYIDLVQKKNIYEEFGVKEYWIVDPDTQSVEIFENVGSEFIRFSRAKMRGQIFSKVLDGLKVDIEKIFT